MTHSINLHGIASITLGEAYVTPTHKLASQTITFTGENGEQFKVTVFSHNDKMPAIEKEA